MRINNFYEEDAIDLYETYLSNNNHVVGETLKALEEDKKLPLFFMNYYKSHEDFMKKFNISPQEYNQHCGQRWCDFEIFRPK